MKKLLLLGCGGNAGINFVKSLKMADNSIKIVGADLDAFNLISSNADEKVLLRAADKTEKLKKINALIREHSIDAIHAQPDPEVMFLCQNKDNIDCNIFSHSYDEWMLFADKLHCSKLWRQQLGLSFESYLLVDAIEDEKKWKNLMSKGERVWCRSIRGAGSKAALPVKTLNEAESWMMYWVNNKGSKKEDFMVSEYLPGQEYAVQTFWLNGNLVHAQARERLVYFFGNVMPSGQSSTPAVAKTIKEQDVYDTALKSVTSIVEKPHGIYCVDLKRNSSGSVIPMEVNYGRFFTTSDFFSTLDVNTPYVYFKAMCGEHIGREDKRINSVDSEFYWIRGLDKEPSLVHGSNL
jgi:carbamoyl-phosphate synthase large subunit